MIDLRRMLDTYIVSGVLESFKGYEKQAVGKFIVNFNSSQVNMDWILKYLFKHCNNGMLFESLYTLNKILESQGSIEEKQECVDMLVRIIKAKKKYFIIDDQVLIISDLKSDIYMRSANKIEYMRHWINNKKLVQIKAYDKIKLGGKIYTLNSVVCNGTFWLDLRDSSGKVCNRPLAMLVAKNNGKIELCDMKKFYNFEKKQARLREIGMGNIDLVIIRFNREEASLLNVNYT